MEPSLMNLGKDLIPQILFNLDDKDLVSYCRTNKAANQICHDQTFWLNRLRTRFPQIDLDVMKQVKEGGWSDVYVEMVEFVRSINWADWLTCLLYTSPSPRDRS